MFSIEEILKATRGMLVTGDARRRVSGISTDSRLIKAGEAFVALMGDNFNGHDFIGESVKKLAGCVIAQKVKMPFEGAAIAVIKVRDTLRALGDIAHFHRMRFSIPVIAVTGSNGKTTTKDMIAHILSVKYNVLKNEGTLNNLVGVPLTLLKLNPAHQVCIVEMGTSSLGQIGRLSDISMPGIAVITNVGPSHLESLKDLKTVCRAKTELFRNFGPKHLAVFNADDALLKAACQRLICKKKTFGFLKGCDLQATNIELIEGGWRFALKAHNLVKIKLLGRHNILNALAAISVCDELGVDYNEYCEAFLSLAPTAMRMQILESAGVTIINDCYNSNPKSMESAVATLASYNSKGRKILVSADMLELGRMSGYYHKKVGCDAAGAGIDVFIGVGKMSKQATNAAQTSGIDKDCAFSCDTAEQAGELLRKILQKGDVVLVKGSRAMKMEGVCSTIYSIR